MKKKKLNKKGNSHKWNAATKDKDTTEDYDDD